VGPSDKKYDFESWAIYTFKDGKVVESVGLNECLALRDADGGRQAPDGTRVSLAWERPRAGGRRDQTDRQVQNNLRDSDYERGVSQPSVMTRTVSPRHRVAGAIAGRLDGDRPRPGTAHGSMPSGRASWALHSGVVWQPSSAFASARGSGSVRAGPPKKAGDLAPH
jgi:hypothetical protein